MIYLFYLFEEDWDQFEPLMIAAMDRFPILEEIPIRKLYNGPESFTSDLSIILDKMENNVYIATGGSSAGIAMAGGIGKTMSELVLYGKTEWDISYLALKRFSKNSKSMLVNDHYNFLR